MKPDLSIVIVRDLYETLASIAVESWNMEQEIAELYPELENLHIKDIIWDLLDIQDSHPDFG